MLGPHRTPSNNETSMEIQSWFLSLDFFFLRRECSELQKASTFQHADSFSHDTPKTHFDFYCCSFTQPRAYKEPWFCYVCAAGSKVLQLLEGETGSRKELIQIMLLCEIRHTSYHISAQVFGDWSYTNEPILILLCLISLNLHHRLIPEFDFIAHFQHFLNLIQDTELYICVYMCFFKKTHTAGNSPRKLNCLINQCFHMQDSSISRDTVYKNFKLKTINPISVKLITFIQQIS